MVRSDREQCALGFCRPLRAVPDKTFVLLTLGIAKPIAALQTRRLNRRFPLESAVRSQCHRRQTKKHPEGCFFVWCR